MQYNLLLADDDLDDCAFLKMHWKNCPIVIDEKGYLILNYPKVIEHVKKSEYFSYYAIIEQYIFEKVK